MIAWNKCQNAIRLWIISALFLEENLEYSECFRWGFLFYCFEKKSIGEGKLRNPLGDFVRSCWEILRSLVTSLGDLFLDVRAVIGDSCSAEGMRKLDITRLHAKNMVVTL